MRVAERDRPQISISAAQRIYYRKFSNTLRWTIDPRWQVLLANTKTRDVLSENNTEASRNDTTILCKMKTIPSLASFDKTVDSFLLVYGLTGTAKNHDREEAKKKRAAGLRGHPSRRMVILIERVIILIVGFPLDKLRL